MIATASLYNIGGFLMGLGAILTVAITVFRTRLKIKAETSVSSIQGFVSLMASYENRLNSLTKELEECYKRVDERFKELGK